MSYDRSLVSVRFVLIQDIAVMDSMQLALENVVSTTFDGSNEFGAGSSEIQLQLREIFDGLSLTLYSIDNLCSSKFELLS